MSNAKAIRNVKNIISQCGADGTSSPVVVVSALYGITDRLLDLIDHAKNKEEEQLMKKFTKIKNIHLDTIKELQSDHSVINILQEEQMKVTNNIKTF